MIQYFTEVSIAWLVFYIIYLSFFKRETFFSINRWYLFHTLIIGLLLPLVKKLPAAFTNEIPKVYALDYSIVEMFAYSDLTANQSIYTQITPYKVLLTIYLIGLVFGIIRMIIGIQKIHNIWKSAEKRSSAQYTLILSNKVELPFSFMRMIFVNKSFLKFRYI